MSNTARLIVGLRNRAAAARHQARTLPVWGLDAEAEAYWDSHGVVYRVKDWIADDSYASRCERAADWLEERAGADTLSALYPLLVIR